MLNGQRPTKAKGKNNVVHSGKINEDGSVTSDSDMGKPQKTIVSNEKEKQDSDVSFNTYKRNGSDKQVTTQAGSASNGVRLVSTKEATEIRKANGLKTTNTAVGQIPTPYPYKKPENK